MKFRIRRKAKGAKTRVVSGAKLLKILKRNEKYNFVVSYVPPKPPLGERIMRVAVSQIGVAEHPPGSNSGTRVREYQASTNVGGTGWPWCQAFVRWVVLAAGGLLPYEGAYVPSFEAWAKSAGKWRNSPPAPNFRKQGEAYAVVFNFDGDPEAEHVGILRGVSADGLTMVCIEGNTSPTTSGSQANGGGVYEKRRPRSQCKGFVKLT